MKNSGTLGGTETKLTAAIKLGLEIVIIDRPRIDYKNLTHDYDCVGTFVAKYENRRDFDGIYQRPNGYRSS